MNGFYHNRFNIAMPIKNIKNTCLLELTIGGAAAKMQK